VADPKILKRGGGGGRQFISSVRIYRKCTQRNVCLLNGKKWLFEKNMSPRLNPPLSISTGIHRGRVRGLTPTTNESSDFLNWVFTCKLSKLCFWLLNPKFSTGKRWNYLLFSHSDSPSGDFVLKPHTEALPPNPTGETSIPQTPAQPPFGKILNPPL